MQQLIKARLLFKRLKMVAMLSLETIRQHHIVLPLRALLILNLAAELNPKSNNSSLETRQVMNTTLTTARMLEPSPNRAVNL